MISPKTLLSEFIAMAAHNGLKVGEKRDFCCETVDNSVPATSLKLNSLKSISFNLYGCSAAPVAKRRIRDTANSAFGDPIRNNAPWNTPYHAKQFPERQCRNRGADIPGCQRSAAERLIARTGLSAWESRGARSQWVASFYTVGTTSRHTHTQWSCHAGKVSACCLQEVSTGIPEAKGD